MTFRKVNMFMVIIGLTFFLTNAATMFYVAPHGNDANVGTKEKPFASIARARDVVRASTATMSDDIIVYLGGGWYTLDSTLIFTPADGGTNGHNVIYQANPGEYPVISGGKQITGWTLHNAKKNIWKAPAPGINTRQLYVNCVRAVRAHKGKGLENESVLISKVGYSLRGLDKAMARWKNQNDIEFVFRQSASGNSAWTEPRCGVDSISDTLIVMKQPAFTACCGGGDYQSLKGGPFDIENAYELLDVPGEWYLDRAQGTVYYIPKPQENITQATVIAPVLESLIFGQGTPEKPICNIKFKGITFAHATYLRPSTGAGWPEQEACYMRGRWPDAQRLPGSVEFQAAHNMTFERCVFKHLGACGLDLHKGSQNNTVVGCVFSEISGNGIELGDVDNPDGVDPRSRDSGNVIINNYIHDSPCEFRGGCGIMAGYVSHTLISHNEVCYTPTIGINVGWGWGRKSYMANNQIINNHVHDVLMKLGDGGCFKSLSPQANSTINNNYFHDVRNVQGCIYLDNGSCHFDVFRNVCQQTAHDWIHLNNDKKDVKDNNIHDNFTDNPRMRFDGENTVQNTTIIDNFNLPQTALEIIANAGIEKEWRDVLTMPCACSVMKPEIGKMGETTTRFSEELNWKKRYAPVTCSLFIAKPFLAEKEKTSGVLAVSLVNTSSKNSAQGSIELIGYPWHTCTFKGSSVVEYNLKPGKKIVKQILVTAPAGNYVFSAKSNEIGTSYSRLPVSITCKVKKISSPVSIDKVSDVLKNTPAFEIRGADSVLAGHVRIGIAGDNLALSFDIVDTRVYRMNPTFVGSSIELYSAMEKDKKISQMVLLPKTDSCEILATRWADTGQAVEPLIQLQSQKTATGYTMQALIPFDIAKIDKKENGFLLELMINTFLPGNKKCSNITLFRSVRAFNDVVFYGKIVVEK